MVMSIPTPSFFNDSRTWPIASGFFVGFARAVPISEPPRTWMLLTAGMVSGTT